MSLGTRSANILALCAAGSLTLEDAAHLLRLRGEAMQKAVPVGEGAMAALLGLDFRAVVRRSRHMRRATSISPARFCQPPMTMAAIRSSSQARSPQSSALSLAAAGAKRALLLPVSAPFHARSCSRLRRLGQALMDVTIRLRSPACLECRSGGGQKPDAIRSGLVAQVTATAAGATA
jgi:[acyl-carrier-protein] S-malonyltransferase